MDLVYCLDQLNEARVIREESNVVQQLNTRYGAIKTVVFVDQLSGRMESMEAHMYGDMRCGQISDDMLAKLRDGEMRLRLVADAN